MREREREGMRGRELERRRWRGVKTGGVGRGWGGERG